MKETKGFRVYLPKREVVVTVQHVKTLKKEQSEDGRYLEDERPRPKTQNNRLRKGMTFACRAHNESCM
ncbi:hypothetical protein F441_00026 [Phytophthora nicotianae CJ01A1]|uniref:Uncharacterized protein n=3 Tax=Phytophthora nicotianae TaxID=4792 RepID=W2RDF5_PHYN3|nr:hypothetical protein PPTG_20632 [Phytophthora nicotianae INRA-310]ETN23412.1 hypothetical protein PPTG_20632 [Phytophthora nicotianae INRA-310]ETO86435.1 hypothetical protein F444_00024 [Phytophthora nicotianae P1976]ETP27466.1 hypothetical protein F441_00026 [Phytophthora nicotianae CJ01A1]